MTLFILKIYLNIPCKGDTKNYIHESRTSFYASNALCVPEGTSDSEAEKIECERNNDPTTPTTDSLG